MSLGQFFLSHLSKFNYFGKKKQGLKMYIKFSKKIFKKINKYKSDKNIFFIIFFNTSSSSNAFLNSSSKFSSISIHFAKLKKTTYNQP